MRVFDCFMFYNEFELLELRLNSLYDMVDYFVLVEADRTLNNKSKPFYFFERRQEFKKFFPKLRYVKVDGDIDYKGVGDWSIEIAQRNAISNGLQDAEPDDLIFISDLDEFPAIDILQRINNRQAQLFANYRTPPIANNVLIPCQLLVQAVDFLEICPIVMSQKVHYYYFDWIADVTWSGTILTKYKNLTTPQELRNLRSFLPCIWDGGHHFSYMGGADRVIDKMISIVDGNEMVVKSGGKFLEKEHVKKAMQKGTDIYERKNIPESQFKSYDVEKINLPYLKTFLTKYPYFLRQGDENLT